MDLELYRVELGSVLEGPLQLGPVCGVHLGGVDLTNAVGVVKLLPVVRHTLTTRDTSPALCVEVSTEAYWAWAVEHAKLPAVVDKGSKLELNTVTGVLELKEARDPLNVVAVIVVLGTTVLISSFQGYGLDANRLQSALSKVVASWAGGLIL